MTCDRFPDCTFSFQEGPLTSDGKKTFVPVCSAGIQGGCAALDLNEIEAFDREHSGGRTERSQGTFYRNEQGVQLGPFRSSSAKKSFLRRYNGN